MPKPMNIKLIFYFDTMICVCHLQDVHILCDDIKKIMIKTMFYVITMIWTI